ncbi:hypothetical protein Srufu_067320 [Streptomyces libani subsp. rufus]|nr:hypothetical protein Srufu_067320 [Streptomyces libani subsp. rufus]
MSVLPYLIAGWLFLIGCYGAGRRLSRSAAEVLGCLFAAATAALAPAASAGTPLSSSS